VVSTRPAEARVQIAREPSIWRMLFNPRVAKPSPMVIGPSGSDEFHCPKTRWRSPVKKSQPAAVPFPVRKIRRVQLFKFARGTLLGNGYGVHRQDGVPEGRRKSYTVMAGYVQPAQTLRVLEFMRERERERERERQRERERERESERANTSAYAWHQWDVWQKWPHGTNYFNSNSPDKFACNPTI
jgi:hypothetical protein